MILHAARVVDCDGHETMCIIIHMMDYIAQKLRNEANTRRVVFSMSLGEPTSECG